MIYVVDTHAVSWLVHKSSKLSPAAFEALGDQAAQHVLPAIVVAELLHMESRGRLHLSVKEWLAEVLAQEQFVLPAGLEIHDALVLATALALKRQGHDEVVLITADKELQASGLIETLW